MSRELAVIFEAQVNDTKRPMSVETKDLFKKVEDLVAEQIEKQVCTDIADLKPALRPGTR